MTEPVLLARATGGTLQVRRGAAVSFNSLLGGARRGSAPISVRATSDGGIALQREGVSKNVNVWIRRSIGVAVCACTVAGIVGCYIFFDSFGCRFPNTPKAGSQRDARVLRMAAQVWRASGSSMGCPTFAQLKSGRYLDPEQSEKDAWGTEFDISCVGDDVTIASAGPDGRWKTLDDIAVPRASE